MTTLAFPSDLFEVHFRYTKKLERFPYSENSKMVQHLLYELVACKIALYILVPKQNYELKKFNINKYFLNDVHSLFTSV